MIFLFQIERKRFVELEEVMNVVRRMSVVEVPEITNITITNITSKLKFSRHMLELYYLASKFVSLVGTLLVNLKIT